MAKKAKKTKSGKKAKKSAPGLRIISVKATANLQPPGPFHLSVDARVEVPTPGYTATLKKAVPQGINPSILLLKVVTTKKPGIWPDHVAQIDATYEDKKYKKKYKKVTVLYGQQSKTAKVHIVV